MTDLIRRGDAREILEDGGFLERSLERLAALPTVTPKVKPLAWTKSHQGYWEAPPCLVGVYYIRRVDYSASDVVYRVYLDDPDGRESLITRPTLDAAKAAAQADYEARIMAALEPVAAPDQCCMCGKRDLSTEEDGGPECQLHDGRWVCSSQCYDTACGKIPHPAPRRASGPLPAVAEAYEKGLNDALARIAAIGYGKTEDVDRGHEEAYEAVVKYRDDWKAHATAPDPAAPTYWSSAPPPEENLAHRAWKAGCDVEWNTQTGVVTIKPTPDAIDPAAIREAALREALFVYGDRSKMGPVLRASLDAYGKANPTRHEDRALAALRAIGEGRNG